MAERQSAIFEPILIYSGIKHLRKLPLFIYDKSNHVYPNPIASRTLLGVEMGVETLGVGRGQALCVDGEGDTLPWR